MAEEISDQITEKLPPPASVSVGGSREIFEQKLLELIDIAALVTMSDTAETSQNTSHISFANINGEMLSARLHRRGISVMTASPCSNAVHKLSPEIKALGLPYSQAMGLITFRLEPEQTSQDIEDLVVAVKQEVEFLKQIGGVD